MLWESQKMKNRKKHYTYEKNRLPINLAFNCFPTLPKVVQVTDYKGFRKPYKTEVKLIIWVFWGCFGKLKMWKIVKKALDV